MSHGPVGEFPVNGKIIVVTGGGSGIGLAFAQACHTKGAKILIGDLKLTEEAQQWFNGIDDGSVKFTKCDVTRWGDLKALVTTSIKEFGDVPDVYAPVAGIFEPKFSNFWDDEEDGFYRTIRINTEHPIKLTRIAINALLGAKKQGVVCLVASGAGLGGMYLCALYSASKHAVVGFAKSMVAADEQEGVKVVCICPGLVETPMVTKRDDNKASMLGYTASAETSTPVLSAADLADAMLRLVVDKRYEGGTIMRKRAHGGKETIVHEGGKEETTTQGTFVQDLLAGERGVPWQP